MSAVPRYRVGFYNYKTLYPVKGIWAAFETNLPEHRPQWRVVGARALQHILYG